MEDLKPTLEIINTNVPFVIELHLINHDETLLESKTFETRTAKDVESMKNWIDEIFIKHQLYTKA
jgi:hypothetical protein